MANLVGRLCAANEVSMVGIGEYGAGAVVGIRGDMFNDPKDVFHSYSEDYQVGVHYVNYRAILDDPRVWGSFVWELFDSGSGGKKESVRHGINNKGLVSFGRKTPKEAFCFYKANWNVEPELHLVGSGMSETTNAAVNVMAFSNMGDVTLSVNGKAVGTAAPDRVKSCLWRGVPLDVGENEIRISAGDMTRLAVAMSTGLLTREAG